MVNYDYGLVGSGAREADPYEVAAQDGGGYAIWTNPEIGLTAHLCHDSAKAPAGSPVLFYAWDANFDIHEAEWISEAEAYERAADGKRFMERD